MSDTPFLGTLQSPSVFSQEPAVRGEGDGPRDAGSGAPRYTRRLSDKILIAFHHACDQADYEIAEQLLQVLETLLKRRPLNPDTNRRRSMESLVAAHERLWHLRHHSDAAN